MDTAFYPVGSPCLRGSTVLVFLTRNEFCIDFRGPHFNNWRFSILQIFGVFTGWVSLAMDLESSLMIYSKTTSSENQSSCSTPGIVIGWFTPLPLLLLVYSASCVTDSRHCREYIEDLRHVRLYCKLISASDSDNLVFTGA